MIEQPKQADERPANEPVLQDLDVPADGAVIGGRITNLRGNASAIGASTTGLPSQIIG